MDKKETLLKALEAVKNLMELNEMIEGGAKEGDSMNKLAKKYLLVKEAKEIYQWAFNTENFEGDFEMGLARFKEIHPTIKIPELPGSSQRDTYLNLFLVREYYKNNGFKELS